MTAGVPSENSLPLSVELRIDAVCRRFEAAWQAVATGGARPRIKDYLPAVEEGERWPLLRELLKLELDYRRAEAPTAEEYCRRFPAYADLIAALFSGQAPAQPGENSVNESDRDAGKTRREQPGDEAEHGQASRTGILPSIPGYDILGELGHGAMGVVYKARHLRLKCPVALKMIRARADAGEQELARFRAQAEAAAQLQHPNIVHIYEVGEHQGLPYFALEFCPGGSLEKKLGGTPLPPQPAAQLVETLARAMHAAHARGIVHRDLKPANVLLVPSERPEAVALGTGPGPAERYDPKVTDFGLAKRLDVEVGQTQACAILGTPSYMAPEQASGNSKEIGPAADVYALGAILYELLTGRPPFKGASLADTLEQVRSQEPLPPRRLQPKCPRDLETICLKCLQREPEKRYAIAEELAADLGRFQENKPILARPVGRLEKAAKWAWRRPAAAALLLVSALALLTLVGGAVAGYYSAWLRDANAKLAAAFDEAGWQRDSAVQARGEAEDARGGEGGPALPHEHRARPQRLARKRCGPHAGDPEVLRR
jgi:hypothetical protein